ncbi:MAG: NADP-dependent malic enzyme [Proteobacteria bacterium]|nr:MAG: NADP-dependent malic enzyme [Pseudomonadota bacterium]
MANDLTESALHYHRYPKPGKLEISPTKPLANQRDLALAYSPGVAAACNAIVDDPAQVSEMTARGNLVAVVTNGTAVLGLGPIGPLAAKPVMEGKAVLFKKFAHIDVFDIEVNETDSDLFVDTIARLEPTFGAINLEDIKAPECFEIERKLQARVNIPVFHDDQHGTAIIVGAATLNGLRLLEKEISRVRLVALGAGAAGIACLELLVDLGLPRENITICDRKGVVYKGRDTSTDPTKVRFAQETRMRTIAEAMSGADIFLGLSGPGVITKEMVATMAKRPLILALANPVPEILPEEVRKVRQDAIMATGRSDYPNQVNNVLCFPYIFRGALDVGATCVNGAMKIAAVHAIADLATVEASDVVASAYGDHALTFGPHYIIPKPFDPRLIVEVSSAVAKAAMESGVATRPLPDFVAYREKLQQYVVRSGLLMKPIFEAAKLAPKRIVYAEGEEERVLRAVQDIVTEGLARPILIGRPNVITRRIQKLGLRIRQGEHFDVVNLLTNPEFTEYWELYHQLMERQGVSPDYARKIVRTRSTVMGALMIRHGEADAMICGVTGRYHRHLNHIINVLGRHPHARVVAAMNVLLIKQGALFICDTHVNPDPTTEEITEMTLLASEAVRRFGIVPKVALLSHSNFGSSKTASALKMAEARVIIKRRAPDLEVEGEMHADTALSERIRSAIFPNSELSGAANLLIMPNMDSANIAYNLLKILGDAVVIGPLLLGAAAPAHVLTTSTTVRRIVNMSALAVVDAQTQTAELEATDMNRRVG